LTHVPNTRSLTDPINVYIVWYGQWKKQDKAIVTDFLAGFGASDYWSIQTKYYEQNTVGNTTTLGPEVPVSSSLTFKGGVDDDYSFGKFLNPGPSDPLWNDVAVIINNHIVAGKLPSDTNGIYVVLGDDQTVEGSSCSAYCSYQSSVAADRVFAANDASFDGNETALNASVPNYLYVYIGNPEVCGELYTIEACFGQFVTQSGNVGVDTMVQLLALELSDVSVDPNVLNPAWYDQSGQYPASDCFGTYGSRRQRDTNGYYYNHQWNGRMFLISQNMDPTTQLCGPFYPGDVPPECSAFHNIFPSLDIGNDCCNSAYVDCANGHIDLIDVQANELTGNIGQVVTEIQANFPLIRGLRLGRNNFTGTFPEQLCKMPLLEQISIAHSPQLTGTLPDCIFMLPSLVFAIFAHNPLMTGSIPSNIESPLIILNLSNNNLTGPVPRSLAQTSSLTQLLLQNNPLLSGPVPSGFVGFHGQTVIATDANGPVEACQLTGTKLYLPHNYVGPTCGLTISSKPPTLSPASQRQPRPRRTPKPK
jgi:hypothetical protein